MWRWQGRWSRQSFIDILCVLGQLHIFASNTEHPTINDYSEEIEFASVVRTFDDNTLTHTHSFYFGYNNTDVMYITVFEK